MFGANFDRGWQKEAERLRAQNLRLATALANQAVRFQESLGPVLAEQMAKAWAEGHASTSDINPYAKEGER